MKGVGAGSEIKMAQYVILLHTFKLCGAYHTKCVLVPPNLDPTQSIQLVVAFLYKLLGFPLLKTLNSLQLQA